MVTLNTLRFVPVFFVLFLPAPFRRWVHVGWCGRTTLVVMGFFRRVPFEKGIVVACLPTGGSPSSDQGEGWNPTLASSLLNVSLLPGGGPVATLGAVCSVSPLLPLPASPLLRGGLPRPKREGLVRIHLQGEGEEEEERKRSGLDPPSHPSPLESTTTQGQPCGWVLGAPRPFDHEQWWWWRRVVIQTHTKGNAEEKKTRTRGEKEWTSKRGKERGRKRTKETNTHHENERNTKPKYTAQRPRQTEREKRERRQSQRGRTKTKKKTGRSRGGTTRKSKAIRALQREELTRTKRISRRQGKPTQRILPLARLPSKREPT
eukprot:scaffold2697_cov346-Pavlova_lutheri.AAC.13